MSGNGTCGRPCAQNPAATGSLLLDSALARPSEPMVADGQVRQIEATPANAVAELEARVATLEAGATSVAATP